MDTRIWQDIADGRLIVRKPGTREETKALHLLMHGGVDLKRGIRTFDALLAATSLELALEKAQKVRFWTADRRLYKILRELDAYKSAMLFRFVGPPKSP